MTTVLERPSPAYYTRSADRARFSIERGVPIPPVERGGGRHATYPFAQMRVGDSFTVTTSEYSNGRRKTAQLQSGLWNLARCYARKHNPAAKFATRKVDDSTVRIWRIA